jgi:NAD(P)-dependent dehydrogenase (short-subunit alcohol dehydrogenase family)
MVARRDGAIINIASTAGVQTGAAMGAYGAAKAGVIQLTKVIAVENVGNGVRANALLVGATDTELVHKAFSEFAPAGATVSGADRAAEALGPLLLKPEGVAGAVLLLCSDAAREITGAEIAVDRALLAGLGHTMLMESAISRVMSSA